MQATAARPRRAELVPDSIDWTAYVEETDWPHSDEAEQSVLGGLLIDGAAWSVVGPMLKAGDFYRDEHRTIWGAIAELAAAGDVVDMITTHQRLQDHGQDKAAGGLKYLNDLAQSVPSATNVRTYAQIVQDKAARRAQIAAGDAIKALARNAPDAAQAAAGALQLLAESRVGSRPAQARPITLNLRQLATQAAPARLWFVQNWLGPGPTLFAAGGGVGKTLLAQETATALAIGRSFIGEVQEPCRSLLWCCEDDADELWRRQQDISAHLDISLDDPADNLTIQSRRGVDNVLMTMVRGEASRTSVYRELQQQVNDLRADVLWLDNVAHLFSGDENHRGEVTAFVNALAGLVTGRPFSVVLLAHTSRQMGSEFAGSAAWENAVRMRWFLGTKLPGAKAAEDADDDSGEAIRYLAKRKANYSAKDYIRFTLRDGVLVPDDLPQGPGAIVTRLDERRAEEVLVLAFKALQKMGVNPSDGKSSPRYLPQQAVEKTLNEGYSKTELARAMNRLMGRGIFTVGEVGSYGSRNKMQGLLLAEQGGQHRA